MLIERLQEHYRALSISEAQEFRFRPSSLGGCMRQQAFLLSGMDAYPPSPEAMRTFELGTQRGLALESACKGLWSDAQTQVPVVVQAGKYALRGSCDVWIPSLRLVVDFKTIGGYGAGLLSSEGVSEDYRLQIHAYRAGISALETNGGLFPLDPREIRCLVVYECKDSDARKGITAGGLIELEVPWEEKLEKDYQARLAVIAHLLDEKEKGTLDPKAVPGLPKSHWRCKTDKDGFPRFCAIGPKRGECHVG